MCATGTTNKYGDNTEREKEKRDGDNEMTENLKTCKKFKTDRAVRDRGRTKLFNLDLINNTKEPITRTDTSTNSGNMNDTIW